MCLKGTGQQQGRGGLGGAVTSKHERFRALRPRAVHVHRQPNVCIAHAHPYALLLQDRAQVTQPAAPKARITVEHRRSIEMGHRSSHKPQGGPRVSQMKQRGRSSQGRGRMERPSRIFLLNPQAKLLEHATHRTRVFAESVHAVKRRWNTAQCSHQQPPDGVAFRSRQAPIDGSRGVEGDDAQDLEVVRHVPGLGR